MARNTSFYYSFLALPALERRAIVAVWDFCRAVDDAVDEAAGTPRERLAAALEFWRKEIEHLFGGGEPETPEGRRLAPFVERFALERAPFDALVDGVAMDIGCCRFDTFEQLRAYCYRVASTVGLICLRIFGVSDTEGRAYAENLGIALQLTNILRDLRADLARGRLYVPLDELAAFGCTEHDLRAGRLTPPVRALLEHQARRAREFYARARLARPDGCRRRLVAAEIMAGIYRALLARIERRGFDVFTAPVRLSRAQKASIALSVWARARVGV